ncbi:hypothetical protein FWI20_06840, partial [Francisella tularensis subsp. holarctica]|nr:hypothetical protein [Francisella tularensis subsp. holarctica]
TNPLLTPILSPNIAPASTAILLNLAFPALPAMFNNSENPLPVIILLTGAARTRKCISSAESDLYRRQKNIIVMVLFATIIKL